MESVFCGAARRVAYRQTYIARGGRVDVEQQTDGGFSAWLPEGEVPDALLYLMNDTCRLCPVTLGD